MVYTIPEIVKMFEVYIKNNECRARAANLINQRHADNVSGKIVHDLVMKFWETVGASYNGRYHE